MCSEVIAMEEEISAFRMRVLSAFNEQCTFCRLKYPEQLDATHIRLKPILWPAVLARFPHLSLPRGSDTPSGTWDWIFWVWNATQKLWESRPPGAFEWLTFLSRQVAVTAEG